MTSRKPTFEEIDGPARPAAMAEQESLDLTEGATAVFRLADSRYHESRPPNMGRILPFVADCNQDVVRINCRCASHSLANP